MLRFLAVIAASILPFTGFCTEYVNTAVKIDMKEGVVVGLFEKDGDQKLFNYRLKDTDYSDGHTMVIYGDWLPEIPEDYMLRLHVALSDDYMAVSNSDSAKTTSTGVRFEYNNPKDGVVLAVSDSWIKETQEHAGVDISTYFTKENAKYAPSYFSKIKSLLDIYTEKLGKYPYDSFKVIDVPYYAGHALESMTFISGRIIGMPFLTEVSLGHELVHQWIGVGVNADAEEGNWAEGLTTFYADMLYADMDGEGAQYRKNAILSYMAHARQGEDGTCLMEFTYNKDKTAQAVGYAKGMMVFSMLETMLGKDDFEKGIRAFLQNNMHGKAGWDDMIKTLEDVSGIYLQDFINGWLAKSGIADFSVSGVQVSAVLDGYKLDFDIINKTEWLEYPLDIIVETEFGQERDYLYMKEGQKHVSINTKTKPLKIIIDPEYRVARLLKKNEMTPVLHQLFSKYEKAVFVSPDQRDIYEPVIKSLKNVKVVSDTANPYMYSDRIMVFMGDGNRAYEKLYGGAQESSDGSFTVKAIRHIASDDLNSYVIKSADKKTSEASAGRISHYGKYSFLSLNGRTFDKEIYETDKGMVTEIVRRKQGVAVQKPLSIQEIVENNLDKKVFLVGEQHTAYAHHENQLEVIKTLHKNGVKTAVGLEMIQRRFQDVLDRYIAGEITQQEMLRLTEYYSRWRFDFRLYKPVFDFAYENGIPLVALNLDTEITKSVSSGGISSLTEKEMQLIPDDIDYTTGSYREDLFRIFDMHSGGRKFENFYEAQLLWDETMAESTYNYMKNNPDTTMVVLAGNGHIRNRYGIADRLKRRSGLEDVVIVQDEEITEGVADYVLYPDEIPYEESPKVGVMIDETGHGLLVKGVSPDTPAEKYGVKKGDIITDFDGTEINDLTDIKIALQYVIKGQPYKMVVDRDGEAVSLEVIF